MKSSFYLVVSLTVPFNYNFIFTRVNTRGTTRNVHSIPVTCLRGQRFLVACVVYFITGTTRVKQATRALTRLNYILTEYRAPPQL